MRWLQSSRACRVNVVWGRNFIFSSISTVVVNLTCFVIVAATQLWVHTASNVLLLECLLKRLSFLVIFLTFSCQMYNTF